jgi:hypothetical protein
MAIYRAVGRRSTPLGHFVVVVIAVVRVVYVEVGRDRKAMVMNV